VIKTFRNEEFTHYIFFLFYLSLKGQTYNIKNFGAIDDGKTICTKAIQQTIDKCFDNGGGNVYIPAGTFVIGTLHLKSNITLYLENGSVLKGSANINDYEKPEKRQNDSIHYGMFYTHKAENVSVSGMGTIDGNEKDFFIWDKAKTIDWGGTKFTRQKNNFRKVQEGIGDGPVVPKLRPYQCLIFSECKNVNIRDIKITGSPFWTLHLADCDAVIVSGIKLWNSLETPNSDGIDITSCTNVTISDCDIRAGDDAIAITGYAFHFEIPGYSDLRHNSENICVINCNLQSRSSGIRIGFLDQNTVRNIQISNVNITNSNRGIGIFLRDEGSIENINISNVIIDTRLHTGDWWGNGEPIHISAVRGKAGVKLGKISHVNFRDIICKGEAGILIYGSKESIIEDISFNHILFQINNSKMNETAGGNIDLRGCALDQQLFSHDIPGIYAQFVKGLSIKDFQLYWDPEITEPYYTYGLQIVNFDNVTIENFKGTSSPSNKNLPVVLLQNGKNFTHNLMSKDVKINHTEK